MSSRTVEFFFDLSSPYGYLASERVDAVLGAAGATVLWRPFLLGAAMKETGALPLTERRRTSEFFKHDFERCARQHGIPFRLPEPFPVATVAACRAVYWAGRGGEDAGRTLAQALFRAFFADNRNIGEAATVLEVAEDVGHEREAVEAGIADPAVKEQLRAVTANAIERGVFGSPFFALADELFWGNDRLEQVAEWLRRGGW